MKVPAQTKLIPQTNELQGRSGDPVSIENVVREIQTSFKGSRREGGVTALRHYPAREARVVPFPHFLPERVTDALRSRGVENLYSHQAVAATLAHEGKNVVVVTPTASGKTLCYNLPILSALVQNPDARALYLFPTKALSQDQLVELNRWTEKLGGDLRTFTYDGDTP
ncbi:MAG TPA: DEAD/DEAH box helicase, partial [Terriglobia bacterium]|nr:DEAD/DEAH box helicase [Terriglobia bacterium]